MHTLPYTHFLSLSPSLTLSVFLSLLTCRETDEWGGDVFLHPRSVVHSSAPEFVVYGQVVHTSKRPYMAGVTAVEVCGGWNRLE
jgi:hypothetical protein